MKYCLLTALKCATSKGYEIEFARSIVTISKGDIFALGTFSQSDTEWDVAQTIKDAAEVIRQCSDERVNHKVERWEFTCEK